jgi:glycosyltransferase involved in cell wall biosynthesis
LPASVETVIVFAHLLNDRSGSPRVLSSAIRGLCQDTPGRLFVGSGSNGALDDAPIPTTRFWYRRSQFRLLTLLNYLVSQLVLCFQLFRARGIPRGSIIYVNTVLPFGAAIYGRLTQRPVIYHLHEVSISPAPLRWLLIGIVRRTASHVVYVSEFHRSRIPLADLPGTVVYNAVSASFLELASGSEYRHRHGGVFEVMMLASLRDYKGVPEFLQLAQNLRHRSDIRFHLVANDEEAAARKYLAKRDVSPNVCIHPKTACPEDRYRCASLVLNLSRPDQCQETFGLTIVEAMAFGIPVIVPPVGGPVEIVANGREGLHIDCRDAPALMRAVELLAADPDRCYAMSRDARLKAQLFSGQAFFERLQTVLATPKSRLAG